MRYREAFDTRRQYHIAERIEAPERHPVDRASQKAHEIIIVDRGDLETEGGVRLPRQLDPIGGSVDADDLMPQRGKLGGDEPIAAPEIDEAQPAPSGAWKSLVEGPKQAGEEVGVGVGFAFVRPPVGGMSVKRPKARPGRADDRGGLPSCKSSGPCATWRRGGRAR